jgi:transcriptional regulator GlxA family with amidase domain
MDEFGSPEPVSDQLYLIDKDRITCSGGAGVADLAAALVERHVGISAARKSLNILILDDSRPAGFPQPAPALIQHAQDDRVRRAALLMEQNISQPLTIADIACQAGVTERQLHRLFHNELGSSPAKVYRAMRTDYGRYLLERTRKTVLEIATMAGFADAAHFAREFRKRFAASPSTFRLDLNAGRGASGTMGDILSAGRLFGSEEIGRNHQAGCPERSRP